MSASPASPEGYAVQRLAPSALAAEAARRRKDLSRSRDEVVHLIKQDLRAPLACLKALRRTIESNQLSPEHARAMRRHAGILARSIRLLIEDLVLVGANGAGDPALVLEGLLLSDQVAQAAELFPDMTILVDAVPRIRVHADPIRLQQLLTNLVRGTRIDDGIPRAFDAISTDRTVTLLLSGVEVSDRYELDIVRLLARAHGGAFHASRGEAWVGVTLLREEVLPTRPLDLRRRASDS
jgi:hypothetical protein